MTETETSAGGSPDETLRGEAAARLLEAAASADYHAQPGSQVLAVATRVRLGTMCRGGEPEVTPAVLPEAAGGITLWLRWGVDGDTAVTFTEDEGKRLVVAVAETLNSELFRHPALPKPPAHVPPARASRGRSLVRPARCERGADPNAPAAVRRRKRGER